ncbi:MAG: hypothetical protein H6838_04825 [Planctomycetes bacterium]|nr:hypothetical protein [Planctomycetota bacterium]
MNRSLSRRPAPLAARPSSLLSSGAALLLSICAANASATAQIAWTQATIPGGTPPARVDAGFATSRASGASLLFGGSVYTGSGYVFLGDTWRWDGTSWQQLNPSASPSPRATTMTYDEGRAVWVLFGGESTGGAKLTDTWEFDGNNWQQINVPVAPSPRAHHGMAYDSARQRVVLFGGYSNAGVVGDTWEYDGTAWTQPTLATNPSPRYSHAFAYDATRQRTVMFGGSTGGPHLSDTWEYDGNDWSQKTPATSPAPRAQLSMVYMPERGCMFAGGYSNAAMQDTWLWNGIDWRSVSNPLLPAPRRGARMAMDPVRDVALLFGGTDNTSLPSTAQFETSCARLAAAGTFGVGCVGYSLTPELRVANTPVLGTTFVIEGIGLPTAPSFAIGFFGLSRNTPPASLTFAGMPNCSLLVTPPPPGIILGAVTTNGACQWSQPVPMTPSLVGLELDFQAFMPAPGIGNPLGALVTNAAWGRIGF